MFQKIVYISAEVVCISYCVMCISYCVLRIVCFVITQYAICIVSTNFLGNLKHAQLLKDK
jgi:hypothetical protein